MCPEAPPHAIAFQIHHNIHHHFQNNHNIHPIFISLDPKYISASHTKFLLNPNHHLHQKELTHTLITKRSSIYTRRKQKTYKDLPPSPTNHHLQEESNIHNYITIWRRRFDITVFEVQINTYLRIKSTFWLRPNYHLQEKSELAYDMIPYAVSQDQFFDQKHIVTNTLHNSPSDPWLYINIISIHKSPHLQKMSTHDTTTTYCLLLLLLLTTLPPYNNFTHNRCAHMMNPALLFC